MIEFIENLFIDKQIFSIFKLKNIGDFEIEGFVAICVNQVQKENYIIVKSSDLKVFLEEENDFVSLLNLKWKNSSLYKQEFNKNTSLIILFENNDFSSDKTKRQILEIEENPYFFKKYVLEYTEEQLSDLVSKLKKEEISELNSLVDIMDFEDFKRNSNLNSFMVVLINLYIKLPILKVPFQIRQLDDLQETINREIVMQELDVLHNLLLTSEIEDVYELFAIPKDETDESV